MIMHEKIYMFKYIKIKDLFSLNETLILYFFCWLWPLHISSFRNLFLGGNILYSTHCLRRPPVYSEDAHGQTLLNKGPIFVTYTEASFPTWPKGILSVLTWPKTALWRSLKTSRDQELLRSSHLPSHPCHTPCAPTALSSAPSSPR